MELALLEFKPLVQQLLQFFWLLILVRLHKKENMLIQILLELVGNLYSKKINHFQAIQEDWKIDQKVGLINLSLFLEEF